jgi:hypothetical protein
LEESKTMKNLQEMIEKTPDKLAEEIVRLNQSSIILVALIDEMGNIVGFHVNDNYRSTYSTDREKYGMIATRLSIGFGAALATDEDGIVSETEAIAIIRRSTIHYSTMIPDLKTHIIAAIWFNRDNTDVAAMSKRIHRLFRP